MYCSTCGKEISDKAGFCPNCGTGQGKNTVDISNAPLGQIHSVFKNKFLSIICAIFAVIVVCFLFKSFGTKLGFFSGVSEPPKKVLTIIDSVYPGTKTTYKQAFDEFFDEPKWGFIEPDGDKDFIVTFTGIPKHNTTQTINVQLSWNEEKQEAYPNWMDINGVDVIETIKSAPDFESMDLEIIDLILDNDFSREIFYMAFLAEVFSPHFVPELVEAERQNGKTLYTSADEAFEAIWSETFSNAYNIEEDNSSWESNISSSQSSSLMELPPNILESSDSVPLYEKYPLALTHDLVGIDYIGMTLGEVIAIHGTDFILPENGWDGANYLYYDNGQVPYLFFFQPYYDTPSDEDIIISVRTTGPDAWIANDLPVPSSHEELRYRLGMSADADVKHFFIGECEIIIIWESPDGPVNYVTIK